MTAGAPSHASSTGPHAATKSSHLQAPSSGGKLSDLRARERRASPDSERFRGSHATKLNPARDKPPSSSLCWNCEPRFARERRTSHEECLAAMQCLLVCLPSLSEIPSLKKNKYTHVHSRRRKNHGNSWFSSGIATRACATSFWKPPGLLGNHVP